MDHTHETGSQPKRSLPIVNPGVHQGVQARTASAPSNEAANDVNIEAEMKAFEAAERIRLGIEDDRKHWTDSMIDPQFKRSERENVTLLICGLTMAHDFLVEGGLRGLGYNVQHIDVPDNAALQYGKEFGNRGQCNPTYFTVGNLVKYLCELRDNGMSTEDVIKKYVFLTAGACGPCRFGMYVTEYRKALRDAGFDGFRVMLFQQTGGFQQATGEGVGLEMNPTFFITLVKGVIIGDVLNGLAYRMRPYEVEVGATDRALENSKRIVYETMMKRESTFVSMLKVRKEFEAVKVDKLRVRAKASIIGEFWAMTTEGDGNYQLQRFLESEGGEPDIQFVTAWLLYTIWEGRRDTVVRQDLRGADTSKYGLGSMDTTGVAKLLAILRFADIGARAVFQAYANLAGFHGYTLPDMDQIAEVSDAYYSNDLRGGEGHMEVGKLILNSIKKKAHITVSVKPFGCMPSASVSDGVQSMITERFPGSIFCPVETSGDGRVNFYSRIQMYMFKARAAAEAEMETTLASYDLTREQVQEFLDAHPRFKSPLHRSPHVAFGAAVDLVHEVAPLMTQTRVQRARTKGTAAITWLQSVPGTVTKKATKLRADAPEIATRVRADAEIVGDLLRGSFDGFKPLFERLLSKAVVPDEAASAPHVHAAPGVSKYAGDSAVAAELDGRRYVGRVGWGTHPYDRDLR